MNTLKELISMRGVTFEQIFDVMRPIKVIDAKKEYRTLNRKDRAIVTYLMDMLSRRK